LDAVVGADDTARCTAAATTRDVVASDWRTVRMAKADLGDLGAGIDTTMRECQQPNKTL